MKLISGSSNLTLAQHIADFLKIPLANIITRRSDSSEILVQIDENMCGEDVFIIQSTSNPTNDNLMELLIIIDSLKRGGARRIIACIPYFGYTRQDKCTSSSSIAGKLVADLIAQAGAHHIITFDLHTMQIEGFFNRATA